MSVSFLLKLETKFHTHTRPQAKDNIDNWGNPCTLIPVSCVRAVCSHGGVGGGEWGAEHIITMQKVEGREDVSTCVLTCDCNGICYQCLRFHRFAVYLYFNCKWVFTRWQCYYNKTQHTNNTHHTKISHIIQNNTTIKRNTVHKIHTQLTPYTVWKYNAVA
jgi:hypothetical protein